MTSTRTLIAALLLVVLAIGGYLALRPAPHRAPAAAPCRHPDHPPALPNGATATQAQMTHKHDEIQGFVNQLEAYQACLTTLADHAGPGIAAPQKQAWLDQGDAAVDEATALAQAFSVQLKTYKARVPAP